MSDKGRATYSSAGVDEEREQLAFNDVMRPHLKSTEASSALVNEIKGFATGHFATVVDLKNGPSVAVTTDGVGTKILVARQAGRYEPIGIDCVANNVNDLICVGAEPLLLLDYIAVDRIDEALLDELARGLAHGAKEAGIAIAGGEIAQVGELLASSGDGPPMFDIVGTALGVYRDRPNGRHPMLDGSSVTPGDVIIGLPSSGLHSNGYSLARHVLFDMGELTLDAAVGGGTLGDALLAPTRIYVRTARALHDAADVHGLVNISGGGLLNLSRLANDVSYQIDTLPGPAPIFETIRHAGDIDEAVMFATFNMGVGLCAVVAEADADAAINALKDAGEDPALLGRVTADPGKLVAIPSVGLRGTGDRFEAV